MDIVKAIKALVHNKVRAYLAQFVDTHLPCQVISYNATDNLVDLQPCIDQIRVFDPNNMQTVTLPPIKDVPVGQFGAGDLWCTVAPQIDSYGNLHVSKYRLDSWLHKGGIVAPTSAILFNRSDGFFEPCACSLMPNDDNGKLDTAIATDRIGFRNRAGTKELSLLDAGTAVIISTGDWAVAYTDLKTAFDQLKTDLNAFVTIFNAHVHSGVTTGAGSSAVSPTPATSSSADMSGAKVSEIEIP